MKIYYMNDTSQDLTVRIIGEDGSNTYDVLKPTEAKTFKIQAPLDSLPYVKVWDKNIVLLSYIRQPATDFVVDCTYKS